MWNLILLILFVGITSVILFNAFHKEKDKQSFNTNPFRVSATVRGGVGWFNVFATYSLTPLFENGRGPELYPFTVGVTLLGF